MSALQVLVVEDSRFFATVLRKGIEDKLGYRIRLAENRAEARRLLADPQEKFFAALVDLHLPDSTEGEVVDDTIAAGLPTIVFTAAFDDELREFVLAKNVVDYVTKNNPTSIQQVLSTLRRLAMNGETKVLVVDDSKISRRVIGDQLRAHRFQVLEAADGRDALAVLERNPDVHLGIIDYNMAGMDGCALVTEIRRRWSRERMVLIGISAYGNNLLSARFMKAGASDFITKPFIPEELFCRIYQNLELLDHIAALTREKAEREQAQRGAAELSSLNETMIASAALGIAVYSGDGACVTVNESLAAMLDQPVPSLRGQDFRKIPAWKHSGVLALAEKVLESGQPCHATVPWPLSHGRSFWASLDLSRFPRDGQPHLLMMVRDVSRRVEADAQVRRLSKAVENSSAGVVITDCQGVIEYVNPHVCQISGYDRDELIGQTPSIFKSGQTDRETYRHLWTALRRGEVWQGEFLNRRKDGGLYWVQASIDPLRGEQGDITHFVAVEEDVTEKRRAMKALEDSERKYRQAMQDAQQANQAKSEFLSSMSHELRTPLNAILGFAQILDFNPKEPLSASQRQCVERILAGGQHLLTLIGEILDLSKIEAGRLELSLENVSLDDALAECHTLVQPMAAKAGLSLSLPVGTGLVVRADYTRLKQVLINLFSNAIKYNRPDGQVRVRCEVQGDRVAVAVEDTGIGIDPSRLEELFKPFSRLGQENSAIEGTGIGLTICRRLADMMDGAIRVHSQLGAGSTFTLTLPQGQADVPRLDLAGPGPGPDARRMRGRVLYVEDNPANMELMQMVFERLDGLHLLTAPHGRQGLELASRYRPDLIILDLNLPDLDGYDILKSLRDKEETRQIPVFALTAATTRSERDKALKAGFQKFLTKPFLLDDLVKALESVFPNSLDG